jgi:hypothetical protein
METIRKYGPYVAVELLLPGGTLIALALYFFRERLSIRRRAVRLLGMETRTSSWLKATKSSL